jgi:hypothetical protein
MKMLSTKHILCIIRVKQTSLDQFRLVLGIWFAFYKFNIGNLKERGSLVGLFIIKYNENCDDL